MVLEFYINNLKKQDHIINLIVEEHMKIFWDILGDHERQVLSDGYKLETAFDDTVYKVKSKMIVIGDVNVDVGCGNAFDGQKKEVQQGNKQQVPKVNDIVTAFDYQETSFGNQKQFTDYLYGYVKRLVEKATEKYGNNKQKLEAFKNGLKQYYLYMKAKALDDLVFYGPCGYDTSNIIIIGEFIGEDDAPTFYYVIEGLRAQKV